MKRAGGQKSPRCASPSFTSGAHGAVGAAVHRAARPGRQGRRARPARQRRRPAQRGRADLLDLPPRRAVVSTTGRARPEHIYNATGGAISAKIPVVVLVDRQTGVGVGDRHRRAAGPPPRDGRRHAHVRQGRLPGGRAAVQRRRARHHRRRVLPARAGATSAAAASSRAPASRPDVQAPDNPKTQAATRRSDAGAEGRSRAEAGSTPTRAPRSAVLEKRGRFLAATPFFARGRRASTIDKPRPAPRAGRATSCWSG